MDKRQIVGQIKQILQLKIDILHAELKGLQEDLSGDSKSSAGDKHETGRAMLHLEQERLGRQLKDLQQQRNSLLGIDLTKRNVAGLGSLIITDSNRYFLSLPLGMVEVENEKILCLSLASPLGLQLNGKKVADQLQFNGSIQIIKEID